MGSEDTLPFASRPGISKCSAGFYRDAIGSFLGRCVPCQCNGLASECEDKTGRCLNCRYNTAGDRCEHCKEGYYGNAALRTCRACPCPFSESGNKEVNGNINCVCKPGYTGERCERCSSGYFGDPMSPGGRCQPCNCNGNGNNCDPRTGAKSDLTTKVKKITNAAAQKDIVEAAEEHANNLAKLAKDLENAVKNASGRSEVRDARDSIEAYQNITDAINAAEAAANEAKEAADNALKVGGTLDVLFIHKEVNKNDLSPFFNRFVWGFFDHVFFSPDDIKEKIEEAKRKAAAVNETTKKTMEKLNNISNEINKINISPSHSNLSNELKDMNQSVNQLLKIIPSLNDKIAEVENVTAKFPPTNNISDSIKNVKELIEQARDAANRITIPMNFKGDGYVELRPPKDLDDLKAYTSLSLKLQRPLGRGDGKRRRRQAVKDEDMFVMYLGKRDSSKNYIGMVLRKSILYTVYKLNSVEYELKSSYVIRSASEPAKFDRVDLHRSIYQDAEIIYTSDVTSNTPGQPVSTSSQGTQNKDLLNISPSDVVFYVGGYPANFTPPASLNLPKYQGCLELISFNDKVVSLYNFQKAERINPEIPCKRYLPPVDSDYYEGTGYGKVALTLRSTTVLVISMSVRARSENALLSFLQMTDWTDIQIIVKTNIEVQIRVTSSLAFKTEVKFNIPDFQEFYVGGIPQGLREKNNITMQPFLGCIKNLKVFSDFQVLQEQVGVSKGCPILRKAQFSLGSSLSSNLPGFSLDKDLTLSLGFKSKEPEGAQTHPCIPRSLKGVMCMIFCLCRPHFSLDVRTRSAEGLLFFAATRGGRSHLVLYMSKGRIRLSVGKQKEIFNREKYNDGRWHSVIFTFEKRKFRLVVDGIRAQDGQLSNAELKSMQEFMSPVFLGSSKDLPKHSVSGCLRNFKMNGALMSNPTTNTGAGPCFEGQTQRGVYFSGNGAHVILIKCLLRMTRKDYLFNRHYLFRGEFMVSVKPKTSLCDGVFHKISVIKRLHVVQLSVDTMDNYKIGPPTSTPILTKSPLFLGGIPGECPKMYKIPNLPHKL
uniref:Si:ch211-241e1.3 n=1 Tax=Oryzias latipes TaxID=8090 RepID=H2MQX0_ORYLA